MSAVTTPAVREQVRELVALVEKGAIMDAFERFYAEDVVMQENTKAATVGKAANREREQNFVNYVKEVHENRAAAVAVDGDRAFIVWVLEFTGVDGTRLRYEQVAQQEWKDGLIVRERFTYDPTALAVAAQ
jgi:ketosteroid isomerase-like protein